MKNTTTLTLFSVNKKQTSHANMVANKARKRLASIRCVLDCVNRIRENQQLPDSLCFVPATIEYVLSPEVYVGKAKPSLHFNVWRSPSKDKLVGRINVSEPKVCCGPCKTKVMMNQERYYFEHFLRNLFFLLTFSLLWEIDVHRRN